MIQQQITTKINHEVGGITKLREGKITIVRQKVGVNLLL